MAQFAPYILSEPHHQRVAVTIREMTPADAAVTNLPPRWQTDWTSDFIADKAYLKYALQTPEGELVALGAYEVLPHALVVHVVYLESNPASNPTLGARRRYSGIGRVLMAFGIKLSIDNDLGGDITFEAKTPELERHYVRDFGAVPLPRFGEGEAPRYLITGEAAKRIFISYLV